jgi:hypothetical protein
LKFVSDLFSTALSGDAYLEIRQIENLNIMPLKVKIGTLQFSLTESEKEDLYTHGKNSARDFFITYVGAANPEDVRVLLSLLKSKILEIIGKPKSHLRVNVALPIGTKKDRLRIFHTENMEKDTDDRLELDIGVGAGGRCWQRHDFVIVDLTDAQKVFESEWKMTKYQQRLIRPSLKSLLSVPIFDQNRFDKSKPKTENPLLGILTFDSDDDLLEDFGKPEVQKAAAEGSVLLAKQLRV